MFDIEIQKILLSLIFMYVYIIRFYNVLALLERTTISYYVNGTLNLR